MFVRHFQFLFGIPNADEHPVRPTSYLGYSSPCVRLHKSVSVFHAVRRGLCLFLGVQFNIAIDSKSLAESCSASLTTWYRAWHNTFASS